MCLAETSSGEMGRDLCLRHEHKLLDGMCLVGFWFFFSPNFLADKGHVKFLLSVSHLQKVEHVSGQPSGILMSSKLLVWMVPKKFCLRVASVCAEKILQDLSVTSSSKKNIECRH